MQIATSVLFKTLQHACILQRHNNAFNLTVSSLMNTHLVSEQQEKPIYKPTNAAMVDIPSDRIN